MPPQYSVVIPVFNSQDIIAETVSRTMRVFKKENLDFEIILINDGSHDNSWQVIMDLALENPSVRSINLLKNYGQHNANLCGFKQARGKFVVTIDDDLQNPPEEIPKLIAAAAEGYDVVIGKFEVKRHSLYRRLGSKLINRVVGRIFGTPPGIVLSNFRLISNQVISRVCEYRTGYPYIPGLVIWFAHRICNVNVQHHPRKAGKSNYSFRKILRLVGTILFNYSAYPLRFASTLGFVLSLLAFCLGIYYLSTALIQGSTVPGWSTLVVLVSLSNAILMAMVAMLGEYTARLLNQTSNTESFVIKDSID